MLLLILLTCTFFDMKTAVLLSGGVDSSVALSLLADQGHDLHAFYLTAIDFETGKVASELFVGTGRAIDNPMLSSDFWPGGVYVGGIRNGIITLRDGAQPEPTPPAPVEQAPISPL